ncbi:hypothetical protein ACR6C2_44950 [Streptomyces sp. INA 01156]
MSNEGVRISSVLRHLASLPLSTGQRALLAGMGPESGLGGPWLPSGPPVPWPDRPSRPRVPSPAGRSFRSRQTGARRGGRPACNGPARPGRRVRRRAAPGLPARSRPAGQGPEALRREWAAGLNQGLVRAGLATIDPADICFPFYGDRLVRALGTQESVPLAAEAPAIVAPGSPSTRAVYEEIIGEAAAQWYVPPESQRPPKG